MAAVRFEELNARTFQEAKYDTAIVPVGSCESHGDHMPFGSDALMSHEMALAVAWSVTVADLIPPGTFKAWNGLGHCGQGENSLGLVGREVSARGVRVNVVAPGPINTKLARSLSPEWQAAKLAELPPRRYGEPHEVAATVLFLASPAASLFVGQTLGPNSGDVML